MISTSPHTLLENQIPFSLPLKPRLPYRPIVLNYTTHYWLSSKDDTMHEIWNRRDPCHDYKEQATLNQSLHPSSVIVITLPTGTSNSPANMTESDAEISISGILTA